jgi:hypothetical protein
VLHEFIDFVTYCVCVCVCVCEQVAATPVLAAPAPTTKMLPRGAPSGQAGARASASASSSTRVAAMLMQSTRTLAVVPTSGMLVCGKYKLSGFRCTSYVYIYGFRCDLCEENCLIIFIYDWLTQASEQLQLGCV